MDTDATAGSRANREADANRALVARYVELWNTGHLAIADALIAPDFVDHAHPERPRGPKAVKAEVAEFRAAFTGAHAIIEQIVAEGDVVAFRFTVRGAHTSTFRGFPPTGETLILTGMDFVRISGGKFAELWSCQDSLAWVRQLGADLRFPGDD